MSDHHHEIPEISPEVISDAWGLSAADQLYFWNLLKQKNPELAEELERQANLEARVGGSIDVESKAKALRLAAFAVGVVQLAIDHEDERLRIGEPNEPTKQKLLHKLREFINPPDNTTDAA